MVTLKTTLGDIVLELDHENTPATATNFFNYVKEGFYSNTIFHRVIDGFMIQGGGFEPGMQQKMGKATIENEADKAMPNKRGTIAMARTSDPHSASSQFFINLADNSFLNFKAKSEMGWGYCVFGKVVEGMDVVDKIKAMPTTQRAGHGDVPVNEVVLEEATVSNEQEA